MPQYRVVQGTQSSGLTGSGTLSTTPATADHWSRGGSVLTTRYTRPVVSNQPAPGAQQASSPLTPVHTLLDHPVPTSTRKISASFSRDGPLAGHPTTAYSAVTASTGMRAADPLTSHPVRQLSTLPASQSYGNMTPAGEDRGLKASRTYSNLPMPVAQYKASAAKPRLISRPSALPTSQSYGNMGASKIGRGLKAPNTYGNPSPPTKESKAPSPKPHPISRSSAMPLSQSHGNLPKPATGYRPSPVRAPVVLTAHPASRIFSSRTAENIPPKTSTASPPTNKQGTSARPTQRLVPKPPAPKKTKSGPGVPKSRALNMISNFTASLSRTSLSQFTGGDSRRASITSKGTGRTNTTPYTSSPLASSPLSQHSAVDTSDPQQIHKAQNSAYWTGRFMALRDSFQAETLRSDNIETLLRAHNEKSLIPVAQPSLTSSATMGCITGAVRTGRLTRSTAQSTTPGRPLQQRRGQTNVAQAAAKPSPPRATPASAQPSNAATAAMLMDEEHRCRRIFSQLDALCTTNAARNSLWEWQQNYARRVGKETLLPEGGTMLRRSRESTWMGRLFTGKRSAIPKRPWRGP